MDKICFIEDGKWLIPAALPAHWNKLIKKAQNDTNPDSLLYYFVPLPLIDEGCVKSLMETVINDRNDTINGDGSLIPLIFIVHTPFYSAAQNYCSRLVKKQSVYSDNTQAFFCAELMKSNSEQEPQGNESTPEFYNILTFDDLFAPTENDRIKGLKNFIEKHIEANKNFYKNQLRLFYDTYVNFYDDWAKFKKYKEKTTGRSFFSLDQFRKLGERYNETTKGIKDDTITGINKVLEDVEIFRMIMNGVTEFSDHSIEKEMFLSPIPFMFSDLLVLHQKFSSSHENHKKIRILLIDNKADKCAPLKEILPDYFDLHFLQILETEGVNKNTQFNLKYPDGTEDKGSISDICDFIDNKQNGFYFVLLDFFLDKRDIFLAFDFILEIGKYRKLKQDLSTTSYFIASSVHDSVTRYTQSGLLTEYSSSAIVNSGDDPTNNLRQIIFLYKLLTFVDSRINNFENLRDQVLRCNLLSERTLSSCKKEEYNTRDCELCLDNVGIISRRFLAESRDILKSLPHLVDSNQNALKIADLIIRIIDQWNWLPEADWAIIQMQIEYLRQQEVIYENGNNGKGKKIKFMCPYIREQLEMRASIY